MSGMMLNFAGVTAGSEAIWLTKTATTVATNYDNRASNAAGIYQGNVVIGGSYKLSGYGKPALAFYNTRGVLQASRYLSFSGTSEGNIYSTFLPIKSVHTDNSQLGKLMSKLIHLIYYDF